MPQLKPEDMTIDGMNLFTQLCSLAKIANTSYEHPLSEEQVRNSLITVERRVTRGEMNAR